MEDNSKKLENEALEAVNTPGEESQAEEVTAETKNTTDEVVENTETEAAPEAVEEPKPEAAPEVVEEPKAEETPEVAEEPKAEAAPEAVEEPKAEAAPEAVEEPKPEAAPEAVEEPKAEETPEAVEEPKAEAAPEVVEEPKAEAAPEVAEEPKADAVASSKVVERKKSEESKIEALRYAEEYRRKLRMEKEARERDNADDEALKALREQEEKNKEAALLREKEEARSHSERMSALLSRIELNAEERAEAAKRTPAPVTDEAETVEEPKVEQTPEAAPEAVEEPKPEAVPEVKDEPAEEKKEETPPAEEKSSDENDDSMVISVDMDISSDVLLIDGVSVNVGEDKSAESAVVTPVAVPAPAPAPSAPVAPAAPASEPLQSSQAESDKGEDSAPQSNYIAPMAAAAAMDALIPDDKGRAAAPTPAPAPVKAEAEYPDVESDIDITDDVRRHIEQQTPAISSEQSVKNANALFDQREKKRMEKERRRLEREELDRYSKAQEKKPERAPDESEIIYPDKELTDEALLAAGIALTANEKKKKDKKEKKARGGDNAALSEKDAAAAALLAAGMAANLEKKKAKKSRKAKKGESTDVSYQPENIYPDVEPVSHVFPETAPVADSYASHPVSEPETVYPDKELDGEALLAAGLASKAAMKKAKKSNKDKRAKKDKKAIKRERAAELEAMMAAAAATPEIPKAKAMRAEAVDTYPDAPEEPQADKREASRELENLVADNSDRDKVAAYEDAYLKKDAKKSKSDSAESRKVSRREQKEAKREAVIDAKRHAKAERDAALDKKQLKKFIKQDGQIDMRFISEYYDHLIREKKLELDTHNMKFNKKGGGKKKKKSTAALESELDALREQSRRDISREEADNKRLYVPVLTDYRTARVKRGADRIELVALRERLINLIHERQDLNTKLINLYLGNEDGDNVYEKRTAAELKGRRKAYKKQNKLEREIRRAHISVSYATKLRALMDAYVMKYGLMANLKVAIKSDSANKKSKREFKRELHRIKRELRRIEADINRYRMKALREAQDRKRARVGAFFGWIVFIGICAFAVLCWVYWDDILNTVLGFLGM